MKNTNNNSGKKENTTYGIIGSILMGVIFAGILMLETIYL